MARKVKRNYVNNPDFLEALVEYKKQCELARSKEEQLPIVPTYIAECIQSISYRLATKPNFSGYSFREDMVMDGIENCLLYIENFDPEKSSNPFAYFTQIIWFAFLRRIAKEKKHLYTKLKSSQSMLALGETHVSGGEVQLHMNLEADYIDSFIEDYEDKMKRDKKKAANLK
jgi:DNA-directed RNA polymerase specialized sigma24 family protein